MLFRSIAEDVGDHRAPRLLHRAERLFLERRQAAGNIARRRIFGNRLTVRGEIGLAAVDQDRKSVASGKSVSVSVDLGGRRIIKKKITIATKRHTKQLTTTAKNQI